jgi:type IV pilus assembly protein PilY1
VSKCTAEDRRVAYHYAAHPLTGGSILKDDAGNPIRAYVGNTLVPAQGDQPTVFVNQKGQVLVGQTVVNPEKGAGVVPAGVATDAVTDLGYIEVSEPTHACRHATAPPAAGVCR